MTPNPKIKPIRLKWNQYAALRKLVFGKYDGKCSNCGEYAPLKGVTLREIGHLAHIKSRGAGGGDTIENCTWKCYRCHIDVEHGPRLSKSKVK